MIKTNEKDAANYTPSQPKAPLQLAKETICSA
jgi:hypothetical protein